MKKKCLNEQGLLTYDFSLPSKKLPSKYDLFTIDRLMADSLGALEDKFGISNLSLAESFQLRRIVEQAADHVLQQIEITGLHMHRDIPVPSQAAYEFVTQNFGMHFLDAYFFATNKNLREPFKVWIELQRDQSHGLGLNSTPRLNNWWAAQLAKSKYNSPNPDQPKTPTTAVEL